jgi:predicted 3-demethylubiquinone-9 3-methyltransferase (glyoxalase superfamily)
MQRPFIKCCSLNQAHMRDLPAAEIRAGVVCYVDSVHFAPYYVNIVHNTTDCPHMVRIASRIQPCLWFDTQAEEAASFYVGIFPNSRILSVSRYGEAGQEHHRMPIGSVMTVSFSLDGQAMLALNGGPHFAFNPAVSLMVNCDTQDEIDHFWNALGAGGDPAAQQCGWLTDRYGVSWQVTPRDWERLMNAPDHAAAQRAMQALHGMKKLDMAALQAAFDGR